MAKVIAKGNLISTNDMTGMRVVAGPKLKKMGKVRMFVFHPAAKRVLGFMVKRPDAALMFHRKDVFVGLDGFDIEDDGKTLVIHDDSDASGNKAIKALGVDWDECVIWVGMPLMTVGGTTLGYVGNVVFDRKTGAVASVESDAGVANDAIVGKRVIPAKMIKGFKRGQGMALAPMGQYGEAEDDAELGAILVADEALDLATEGGVAEVAGKATAVATDKVKKASVEVTDKAKKAAAEVQTKAKPTLDKAAKTAGKAVEKGAYATGKQIKAAGNMFGDFKEEFDKALNGEDEPTGKSGSGSAAVATKKTASKLTTKNATDAKKKSAEAERSAAIKKVAKKAGPAESAVIAAGEHLNKVPGMFGGFAEEFKKALEEDDE